MKTFADNLALVIVIIKNHPKEAKTGQKRRISFQPELLRFFLKRHLLFLFHNTSVFTRDCLPESFLMQERSVITIFPKKSGYLTENLFLMVMLWNFVRCLSTI